MIGLLAGLIGATVLGAPPADDLPPLHLEPPPSMVREARFRDVEARDWFTGQARLVRPIGRMSLGYSGRLTGAPVSAFTLDLMGGVRFGVERGSPQFGGQVELGYSLRAPDAEHRLLVGGGLATGVALGDGSFLLLGYLAYEPSSEALGARATMMWDFAENGFTAEVSYDYLPGRHDIRLLLGVDLAALGAFLLMDREPEWF